MKITATIFLERSIFMRKIIDFHAHIFNPKIAHLAIANLEKHYGMPWECLGTFTDMREEMEKSGFSVNSERLVCYGLCSECAKKAH